MTEEEFFALQNKILAETAQVDAEEEAKTAEKEALTTIRNEATRAKSTNAVRAEKAREYLDPIELVRGMQGLLYEADDADSDDLAVLQFKLNVYKELLKKVLPDLKALEVKTEGVRGHTLQIDMSKYAGRGSDLNGEKVVN
jgi:hypothetical protein